MSRLRNPQGRGAARAGAVVRLCSAREELWRARGRHADAVGTPAEPAAAHDAGAAAAELAAREQWLHWIDHGTSIRPEADGEWGWAADPLAHTVDETDEPRYVRPRNEAARRSGAARARRRSQPVSLA